MKKDDLPEEKGHTIVKLDGVGVEVYLKKFGNRKSYRPYARFLNTIPALKRENGKLKEQIEFLRKKFKITPEKLKNLHY